MQTYWGQSSTHSVVSSALGDFLSPSLSLKGKGIFLIQNLQQVRDKLAEDEQKSKPYCRPIARIAQRSVTNYVIE